MKFGYMIAAGSKKARRSGPFRGGSIMGGCARRHRIASRGQVRTVARCHPEVRAGEVVAVVGRGEVVYLDFCFCFCIFEIWGGFTWDYY